MLYLPGPGVIDHDFHGTLSVSGLGHEFMGQGPGTAVWPAANRAIFIPVILTAPFIAMKMFWVNGAAVSGNVDAGIYTEDLAKIVGVGSTAQAGTSIIQEGNITDTYLAPGTYYLALIIDNTTGTNNRFGPSVPFARAMGAFQMATTIPLPSTATITAMASAYVPVFGMAGRTLVA